MEIDVMFVEKKIQGRGLACGGISGKELGVWRESVVEKGAATPLWEKGCVVVVGEMRIGSCVEHAMLSIAAR